MFTTAQVENLLAKFRNLANEGFPHHCACGRSYKDLEDFLARTTSPHASSSGMVASLVGEGAEVVDLFRNCACGSTIMVIIQERRNFSRRTRYHRHLMQATMDACESAGVSHEQARGELLACIRGFRGRYSEEEQELRERELLENMLAVCSGLGITADRVWRELEKAN